MFSYWFLFGLFSFASFLGKENLAPKQQKDIILLFGGGLLIALAVGLRDRVGGDWYNYLRAFDLAGYGTFSNAISKPDPGYAALNWIVQRIDGQVWLVNLICASIFSWGLIRLAMTQPRPWTVVMLAIPYLVIVVAMGYTRQSVAIGIIMAALAAVIRGASIIRFLSYIICASLFHRSSIVVIPFVTFAVSGNKSINIISSAVGVYFLYDAFVSPTIGSLYDGYIEAEYSSEGAAIRVALVVIPAFLFLVSGKKIGFSNYEAKLWKYFSFFAIVCLFLLFVLPSSTVTDRLALLVLPMQIVVLARIPSTLVSELLGKVTLFVYSAAILFVWLRFATHSEWWIPYRNYLWV